MGDVTINFYDFETIVKNTFPGGDIRYGQWWFNLLYVLKPEVADKIRGTLHDPFHYENVSLQTSQIAAVLWEDINAHDFVA